MKAANIALVAANTERARPPRKKMKPGSGRTTTRHILMDALAWSSASARALEEVLEVIPDGPEAARLRALIGNRRARLNLVQSRFRELIGKLK